MSYLQDELVKLRRENKKALQMIKGCMKKIQQQDREIKKIKLVSFICKLAALHSSVSADSIELIFSRTKN